MNGMYGIKYLIFAGGGMNTAHYAGMLRTLEEMWGNVPVKESYGIEGAGGTSGGALYALFVVLGLSFKEIETVLTQVNIKSISFTLKGLSNLLKNFGLHDDEILKEIVSSTIKFKFPGKEKSMTLEELCTLTKCKFGAVRVDALTGKIEVVTETSHPATLVVDAVVDSMRIPPFLKPREDKFGNMLIDGGVLLNFPFEEIFHAQSQTLGFHLVSKKQSKISDPIEWIRNLYRLMQNEIERLRFESYDPFFRCFNILSLEIDPSESVNFAMERNQIDVMVERGAKEMKLFLLKRSQFVNQMMKWTQEMSQEASLAM